MNVLLPRNASVRTNPSLQNEPWQMPMDTRSSAKKSTGFYTEDSKQQALLDEERLQQWRMRMRQIRRR
jgi:hypothetical protein